MKTREQIARQLTADLERATDKWGIHVLRWRHHTDHTNFTNRKNHMNRKNHNCSSRQITQAGNNMSLMFIPRVEIKDVCLAREMQRVMAAEAEATRDARAKVMTKAKPFYFFNEKFR